MLESHHFTYRWIKYSLLIQKLIKFCIPEVETLKQYPPHLNHFLYRCDDCTYATKHLHSLKLHLRKNSHKPAMTLNNDGCPFPYRCTDCNYSTKYCHSLKLHLRKYAHKPAMVLSNDGTPNPNYCYFSYNNTNLKKFHCKNGPKFCREAIISLIDGSNNHF